MFCAKVAGVLSEKSGNNSELFLLMLNSYFFHPTLMPTTLKLCFQKAFAIFLTSSAVT